MANRFGRPRNLAKVGASHGRLTILEPTYKDGLTAWRCMCSCGQQHVVKDRDLKNTHSCGCLRIDKGKANKTHGLTKTPTWQVWHGMKQRCLNPKAQAWKHYGGRGITVCESWVNSFETFLADMGEKPNGASLDRIDNEKGYRPDNCRWASAQTQNNNRRCNVRFEIGGVQMTLAQAARASGKSIQVLSWRLYKMGMTIEQACATPLMRQGKKDSPDAEKCLHYMKKLEEIQKGV